MIGLSAVDPMTLGWAPLGSRHPPPPIHMMQVRTTHLTFYSSAQCSSMSCLTNLGVDRLLCSQENEDKMGPIGEQVRRKETR